MTLQVEKDSLFFTDFWIWGKFCSKQVNALDRIPANRKFHTFSEIPFAGTGLSMGWFRTPKRSYPETLEIQLLFSWQGRNWVKPANFPVF
jgi:hypothetical protein